MIINIFYQTLTSALKIKAWTASRLKKINIITVRDMLFHLPYSYMERKLEPDYSGLSENDQIVTTISITKSPSSFRRARVLKYEGINTRGQKIEITFFQISKLMMAKFRTGNKITICGKVTNPHFKPEMIHPEIVFTAPRKIQPVYHLTQGINNNQLHQYALYCLNLVPDLKDWHNLASKMPSIYESLQQLHNPKELKDTTIYKNRLALEEILINQICLNNLRSSNKLERKGITDIAYDYHKKVFDIIGFTPTEDQKTSLEEIYKDQKSPSRMIRMLQGDVGSGKTFVALLSILNVVASGKQCCLMSPTDILTIQHFNFFTKALTDTNLRIEMITSKIKGKKRKEILENLTAGNIDIIIGTHSLIQDNITFANLGYIVIDEQHKFGVKQRATLLGKSQAADLLLMSATPIPRSLSMVLYGDMDISYINSKPKNNLPIITTVISSRKMLDLITSLQRIFDKNQQVYWICPLIQDSEKKSFTSVVSRFDSLRQIYHDKVGLLHGALAKEEKEEIMNDFKDNKIKLLVSTTVIEVGIDVPNATLIIIEDAQNFGLAQLHQLRGRVGRSHLQSYCVLVYSDDTLSTNTKERLNIMTQSQNGFEIAEKDLELRGSGDITGLRQSGQACFTFVDLYQDRELIVKAKEFLSNNPDLKPDQKIIELFAKQFFTDDIGAA